MVPPSAIPTKCRISIIFRVPLYSHNSNPKVEVCTSTAVEFDDCVLWTTIKEINNRRVAKKSDHLARLNT